MAHASKTSWGRLLAPVAAAEPIGDFITTPELADHKTLEKHGALLYGFSFGNPRAKYLANTFEVFTDYGMFIGLAEYRAFSRWHFVAHIYPSFTAEQKSLALKWERALAAGYHAFDGLTLSIERYSIGMGFIICRHCRNQNVIN